MGRTWHSSKEKLHQIWPLTTCKTSNKSNYHQITELHPNVVLCTDLFYMLDKVFHLTVSRVHLVPTHTRERKLALQKLANCRPFHLQAKRFKITEVQADNEFAAPKNSFPGVHFTICSVDNHMPLAETAIRTMNKTVQAIMVCLTSTYHAP
jgi:hypothetical protein